MENVDGVKVSEVFRKGKDMEGSKVVNQYKIGRKIGEGGWAEVFVAECNGELFVVGI